MKDKIKAFFAHSYIKKLLVFLAVAGLCGFIATVILSSKPDDKVKTGVPDQQVKGMPVTVRSVEAKEYPAIIKALGEVVPLWQAAVKAQVGGKIVFLSKRLHPGNMVKHGELLVRIEKSSFEMQVAEARSRLAAAEATLLREEREAREARKNWERSGIKGKPESPLVLREPQLKAARSDMDAARATLAHAKTLLGYTDIKSPFDGVIIQRTANPGETLFAGDEVTTLYSMETAEVSVHLDTAQWSLLPEPIYNTRVKLTDPEKQATWDARVVRESRRLNRESRLRTIYLQVKEPLKQKPPLLPGTFVRTEMTGRNIPGLLRIPEAALTKQGIVWFVGNANRLRPRRSEPVFYGENVVYISAPENTDRPLRVAVSPNSSFTGGLVIQPIAEREEQ
ncbi:MAG: efflux RND transporter periplasmic adaptor subunit [Desulfobacterales bacterium]|nr:efflux RND transporter periplasmic adaptor subunit [Desulfobacterales bacterium]